MSKLKEYRKAHNYKQYEVADAIGVSRSAYSNYENDIRPIPLSVLVDLGGFFNVDISVLSENKNSNAESILNRIEEFFDSDIEPEKKEKLYQEIMKLYLKYKG